MHSQKFEDLVHQVLQTVNFRFKVADDKGEMHEATEWYQVSWKSSTVSSRKS